MIIQHTRLSLVIAAAACAVAMPLTTQAQEKEQPPVGSEPRGFELPAIETYSLRNGVDVTLVPFGRVPKTNIRIEVRAGNLNDGDKTWIADLTSDMMEEGAGGRSASEIAKLASSMGGNLNLGVGLDRTFATMDVLSDSAPGAIALLADVLQKPDFPEDEFDKRKANILRNLSVSRSQPQAQAQDAFDRVLYPDHPYGVGLPADDTIKAFTLDDVKAFHAANFGGKRTSIYVVGQFDRRDIKRSIKKAFGKWDAGAEPLELPSALNENPELILIDRPGAPQSTVRLGKRVPALDGSIDLAAANTLLGGYFSSRITRNIREDKGYTYSPNSIVSTNYKVANWQQSADITSEATGPALAEIIKEIKLLQTEAPSDAELTGIKNYMNGIFVIRLASRAGMANQLSFSDFNELGADYLETYVDKVQALTAEDMKNVTATHLNIDEMTLVVVGPLDMVREQLAQIPEFADRVGSVDPEGSQTGGNGASEEEASEEEADEG